QLRERIDWIPQLLHVRQIAARLNGEEEPGRNPSAPCREKIFGRQTIEAVVHFDRVEAAGVELEPPRLRKVCWIEITAPVPVLPSRAADAEGRQMSRIRNGRSGAVRRISGRATLKTGMPVEL